MTLRTKLAASQSAVSPAIYRSASRSIVKRLLSLPEVANARTIHVFIPVVSRREPDLKPLLSQLLSRSVQIVSPVVEVFGHDAVGGRRLSHREITAMARLVTNRWGIQEPVEGFEVPTDRWDVILVPALGMDRQGNRIGYGYGYYDELLRYLEVPIIVPILSDFILDTIPSEIRDIRIPTIVTEHTILRTDVT